MRIAGLTALIATLLLAIGGTTAFAQSAPSARGYDESLGVIGEIQSEEPTPPAQAGQQPSSSAPTQQSEGSLPFTGLDLGIVALMGAALLGTGLVLRRTTRRSPST
ncbi:MAG TPA: hypothetical protein VGW75_06660 [Solirubrobacteraceae bacterium]|jgi:hypothetical protein|nr:hypothetical protein [Solirubrobacteraceae bacterium]